MRLSFEKGRCWVCEHGLLLAVLGSLACWAILLRMVAGLFNPGGLIG
jgi:hypothetical protein